MKESYVLAYQLTILLFCIQAGLKSFAFISASGWFHGLGGCHLSSPIGGKAKGTPRKEWTPFLWLPFIIVPSIWKSIFIFCNKNLKKDKAS